MPGTASQATEFHPTVTRWFDDHFPGPTDVQLQSWPRIASGAHVLITAPTGSGKTLTAFLWSLSQFAEQNAPRGRTRVLYISPLKALNNDIKRNLEEPLADLQARYGYPHVTALTRSGDTSQSDRQRMLRQPPDILITTPESLGLLLTTAKGRAALGHVETVILDEIHAIVDNRRGVSLMTHLERLADIAGEFQRIALSATVNPLEAVARYVAGRDADGRPRKMEIVNAAGDKAVVLTVNFPAQARQAAEAGQKIWEPLSKTFREVIDANTSTLFFTNSRRLAEKITLKVNQDQPEPVAYAHHGSLAREVRHEVERRLKGGELAAIVATNSLEMGIDIGHLDQVVLVQSPPSVAATLQRIGRAGHRVGETSHGALFPTHAHDFLEAAALGQAVAERDIEPLEPMHGALDVLAQLIVSIAATDPWPTDDLYALLTRATPYARLSREHFDLVIDMLAGRYAGSRIRELKPKLTYDRVAHTVQATRGAVLNFYNSGGTIPDRGYYQLKHVDTGAAIGELDEEFVWEATIGDTFTFGTQHWQIQRITHNDVIVRHAQPGSSLPPFWRSETFNRSFHFSQRIAGFLEAAEGALATDGAERLHKTLTDEVNFEETAATELVDYLTRQRAHTEAALPHEHHLVLELVKSGPGGYRGPDDPQQLVIHTMWGGRLNQPLALALRAAWATRYATKLDIHADNDAIALQAKGEIDAHEVMTLVTPENLVELLRASLESSGFFGARFRECAGRALLLNKQRFNQRLPLWMSRMQAKKLMGQVKKFADFPVMLETWRTCLDDEFDLPALNTQLERLQGGEIGWTYVTGQTPSPFAKNLTFDQVSRYMYADDTPEDDALSALSADLIGEALANPSLRPRIERGVVAEFEAKRQRRAPGYEPHSEADWGEWLKERILIPEAELPEDLERPAESHWIAQGNRRWLTHTECMGALFDSGLAPGSLPDGIAHVADPRGAFELAREILTFYGPVTRPEIEALLPTLPDDLLTADDELISGQLLVDDDGIYWCDAENFEALMRFQRAQRRSTLRALPSERLPEFWAGLHRLHRPLDEAAAVYALENLRGYPAAVATWLYDLMGARVRGFAPADWEDALTRHGFAWRGTGKEAVTFAYPEELALFPSDTEKPPFAQAFADPQAHYHFNQIVDASGQSGADLNEAWWSAVWTGQLTADAVAPLKQAYERRFELDTSGGSLTSRRRLRGRAVGWNGHWSLAQDTPIEDPLTRLERDKEAVRLVLDRYGFVNRDLINREGLGRGAEDRWRWRDAFRALRVMELAGEVVMGHFFADLATPQFAWPRTVSVLSNNQPGQKSFWIAANDPVSPCGLGLPWPELPQRRAGNYLAFDDGALALVVEGHGRDLTYHVAWDHPSIDEINGVLAHLLNSRRKRIDLRSIDGDEPLASPHLDGLARLFSLNRDHKSASLEPGF